MRLFNNKLKYAFSDDEREEGKIFNKTFLFCKKILRMIRKIYKTNKLNMI
jgi:hypothetical protein